MLIVRFISMIVLVVITALSVDAGELSQSYLFPNSGNASEISEYVPRFGRSKPVIAVVGENTFTELTDYVVPYGVLHESGIAEVIALATQEGPIQMFPALKIQPQMTIDAFDHRFPEGSDYVIVPAIHRAEDAPLLNWVSNQAKKGATIIGICDGVWVLANAGLLKGRKVVGHWYSFDDLENNFPETTWLRNRRYVVDGKIVTTTGVTASIPVSLALVEAIAGHDRAASVAYAIGVGDWNPIHRSRDFKLRSSHLYTAALNWLSFWKHEDIGIPIVNGINEVALALAADAYSRTYRSKVYSISAYPEEVHTHGRLLIVPDSIGVNKFKPDITLYELENTKPASALDAALIDIAEHYGFATSDFVALQMEYPKPK